jgi:HlyD family secretion protein
MKRVILIVVSCMFVTCVGGTFWFLWQKSHKPPKIYPTEIAAVQDLVKKTVATGAIVPRQEVEIKPRVSGVLEEIYVEPGVAIKHGAKIAKIKIVPNAANLNQAESAVRSAKIGLDNARREFDRNQALYTQGVIAEAELARFKTEYALRKQEYDTAGQQLQIVREGQTRGGGASSNVVVTSTVDGMVIDVPVKVGDSVIESNNFNPGTTIATVANMNDMIFQGQVDESEVGKIKEGMPLRIKIGALETEQFDGKLEYISPKGKEIDGAIQFEIKAKVIQRPGIAIRANYSANADIVLDEKKQVLAIREALVQYKDDKPFVEIETKPQTFAKHDVKLGLSDGIKVEILSGVTPTDKLKVPEAAGPPGAGGSGSGGPGKGKGGPPPGKK